MVLHLMCPSPKFLQRHRIVMDLIFLLYPKYVRHVILLCKNGYESFATFVSVPSKWLLEIANAPFHRKKQFLGMKPQVSVTTLGVFPSPLVAMFLRACESLPRIYSYRFGSVQMKHSKSLLVKILPCALQDVLFQGEMSHTKMIHSNSAFGSVTHPTPGSQQKARDRRACLITYMEHM